MLADGHAPGEFDVSLEARRYAAGAALDSAGAALDSAAAVDSAGAAELLVVELLPPPQATSRTELAARAPRAMRPLGDRRWVVRMGLLT